MPEICRFLGIVIAMYHNDHAPPHFHAKYSGKSGRFSIREIGLIERDLPPRVTALVIEWAIKYQEDLLEDWQLAEKGYKLKKIAPLV